MVRDAQFRQIDLPAPDVGVAIDKRLVVRVDLRRVIHKAVDPTGILHGVFAQALRVRERLVRAQLFVAVRVVGIHQRACAGVIDPRVHQRGAVFFRQRGDLLRREVVPLHPQRRDPEVRKGGRDIAHLVVPDGIRHIAHRPCLGVTCGLVAHQCQVAPVRAFRGRAADALVKLGGFRLRGKDRAAILPQLVPPPPLVALDAERWLRRDRQRREVAARDAADDIERRIALPGANPRLVQPVHPHPERLLVERGVVVGHRQIDAPLQRVGVGGVVRIEVRVLLLQEVRDKVADLGVAAGGGVEARHLLRARQFAGDELRDAVDDALRDARVLDLRLAPARRAAELDQVMVDEVECVDDLLLDFVDAKRVRGPRIAPQRPQRKEPGLNGGREDQVVPHPAATEDSPEFCLDLPLITRVCRGAQQVAAEQAHRVQGERVPRRGGGELAEEAIARVGAGLLVVVGGVERPAPHQHLDRGFGGFREVELRGVAHPPGEHEHALHRRVQVGLAPGEGQSFRLREGRFIELAQFLLVVAPDAIRHVPHLRPVWRGRSARRLVQRLPQLGLRECAVRVPAQGGQRHVDLVAGDGERHATACGHALKPLVRHRRQVFLQARIGRLDHRGVRRHAQPHVERIRDVLDLLVAEDRARRLRQPVGIWGVVGGACADLVAGDVAQFVRAAQAHLVAPLDCARQVRRLRILQELVGLPPLLRVDVHPEQAAPTLLDVGGKTNAHRGKVAHCLHRGVGRAARHVVEDGRAPQGDELVVDPEHATDQPLAFSGGQHLAGGGTNPLARLEVGLQQARGDAVHLFRREFRELLGRHAIPLRFGEAAAQGFQRLAQQLLLCRGERHGHRGR